LGFADPEHTHRDGHRKSQANFFNEAGHVVGRSERFNGGNTSLGTSTWLFDGTTTIDIAIKGAEHIRQNGNTSNRAVDLNEAGTVVGHSQRYNGGRTIRGQTAWLYDGISTLNIGKIGAEYSRPDGFRSSSIVALNEAGQVLGNSQRFSGSNAIGRSVWLYDGSSVELGLTAPEFVTSNGYRFSDASVLNEAGQVAGYSERHNASVPNGTTAWFYDGMETLPIGLIDADHTRNDGYQRSAPTVLSESGKVIGWTERFGGGGELAGQSAWIFNGTTSVEIGMGGSEHTRDDGYQFSRPDFLNTAGVVAGFSERFAGGESNGITAWLHNGATSISIGLTGTEHTRSDGLKRSYVYNLNESGQATGVSERYNGGHNLGAEAWHFDGTSTIEIGLSGSEHTRDDGLQRSRPSFMNEAGQVLGISERYNGSVYLGSDAWVYVSTRVQTIPLRLSTRSDGYAESYPLYLSEDGLVLGLYTLYDAFDNDLGIRAFYFTVEDGIHDLGALVQGGLSTNGWEQLANAIRSNGLGQIIGNGLLADSSGNQTAFLLTPVPEPSAIALMLVGVIGFSLCRPRATHIAAP
jgi:hypothetical protein